MELQRPIPTLQPPSNLPSGRQGISVKSGSGGLQRNRSFNARLTRNHEAEKPWDYPWHEVMSNYRRCRLAHRFKILWHDIEIGLSGPNQIRVVVREVHRESVQAGNRRRILG